MKHGERTARSVAALTLALITLVGCARFDDSASTPFTPEPSFGSADIGPGTEAPTTSPAPPPTVPPGPCVDPDANVVATCLDPLAGLVVLPDGQTALVAERRTGRIVQVGVGTAPVEIARVPIDSSGDGGLLDIALSPTFAEDRLMYAYISTASDNRVVRIAPGDVPKPVLTGIPRGATSNVGAIDFAGPNDLLVLTGDTGNPAAANDPTSLAGKLLRVNDLGATGAPKAPPQVVMSGIGRAGDVCIQPGGSTWVTDANAVEDRLSRVTPEGVVVPAVWTWPDRPGVAGCAVGAGSVAVSLTGQRAMAVVTVDPQTNGVTTAPAIIVQDQYGRLTGASIGPDGQVWASTANKDGGQPTPTDDRVVKIPIPAGGGGAD